MRALKTVVFCFLLAGVFAAPSRKPTFRRGLNKIVGGIDAQPGEIPYQLSCQDKRYGDAYHICGASIYSENWAISSGHCFENYDLDNPYYLQVSPAKKHKVVAGDTVLDVVEGTEQTVILSQVIRHEGYDYYTMSNDISLLRLSLPLTFTPELQPIPLPTRGHIATGDCVVSGWGATTEDGSSANVLQKVTVPVMSDEECRAVYGDNDIEDSMICAGVPEGGKDSCHGDSGGPLACSDTGSPYLAGIVSWGYGCARPGFPGVYCEVAYFIDWIEANAVLFLPVDAYNEVKINISE